MKTKKIETVNGYKNRKFQLCMNINNAPFEYPGVVIESYGTLCLVQEQKASYEGRFNTYGIYNVRQNSKGEESLSDFMIDYGKDDDAFPVYAAPESQVRGMFADLVSRAKEQESIKASQDSIKAIQTAERDKREKVKAENLEFINTRLSQVNVALKELAKTRTAKEIFKEGHDLIIDTIVLGEIKKLLQ